MGLFKVENNILTATPEVLVIPEFRCLWERDKSKQKDKARADLIFVYYLEDFDSPYSVIPLNLREREIQKDFIKDNTWKKDEQVTAACNKYRLLTEKPLMRLLRAVDNTIDRMADYLNATEIDSRTIKAIKDTIKDVSTTISSRNKLQDAVRKESLGDSKTRGGKDIGEFER